ncbi:MAG: hypothetical protein HRT87_01290 [Legionellales bacterium]|nr:hypothetical protein [Legionellales bacterium]
MEKENKFLDGCKEFIERNTEKKKKDLVYFIGILKGKHVVRHCSKYRNKSHTGTLRFKTNEEAQKEADKLNKK